MRLVARIQAQTSRVESMRKAQNDLIADRRGVLTGYYAEICANAVFGTDAYCADVDII